MDRRCASDVCQIKAVGRPTSLDVSLSQVLVEPSKDWQRMTAGRNRIARDIQVDWKKFSQDEFIFSHCTIVASVATEDNGYHIDPVCSPLVNNNGNAWTNPLLLSSFRSFVGGENYLEHVQIPELSKGKILDAVIRPVNYMNTQLGKDASVYYVDILVATERRHTSLCSRIASGELSTMSMGCLANWVQCSRCGSIMGDDDPNCEHIERQLGQSFVDENGIKRVVAELCGRSIKDPTTGSWVGDTKTYFYKGFDTADCIEFIDSLGLI